MKNYLYHSPKSKWTLIIIIVFFVLNVDSYVSNHRCNSIGSLRCTCSNKTYNCSRGLHPIVPIMLDPTLIELDLSHNQIKQVIELNSIYKSLEYLDLSYNLINSNETDFEAQKLKKLNLAYNQLTSITEKMFKNLPSLIDLNLEGNRLFNIPANSFSSLKNLVSLHLENNLICQLDMNSFKGLEKLSNLFLNNNLISFHQNENNFNDKHFNSSININLFKFTKFPNNLNKCNNSANSLALHLFVFKDLKYLDLSSNPLITLNQFNSPFSLYTKQSYDHSIKRKFNDEIYIKDEFKDNYNISKLKILKLNNCSLSKIDEKSFYYLKNLVKLDLNNNFLNEVPSKSFEDVGQKLEQLQISSNSFEKITQNAFYSLLNLIELKLNDQLYLNQIHPFAFNNLNKLQHLEINNNSLLEILDHQVFTGLNNLKVLTLENSSLTTLDSRLAVSFQKLTWFYVTSQKFNCNCSVQWLKLFLLKLKSNKVKLDDLSSSLKQESIILCSTPEILNSVNLIELTTEQLGCFEVKSFMPVVIAFLVGLLIVFGVIIICAINCRTSLSNCIKRSKSKKNSLNKFNTGDHLTNLHPFTTGPSIEGNANNYAYKLGLYSINNINSNNKFCTQNNKVFSTSSKPLINELSHFDSMYKPPLISSNNFNSILLPNSKTTTIDHNRTLLSKNRLLKLNDKINDDHNSPMIKCLTNPYQVVPVLPPSDKYNDQDYLQHNFQQNQHYLLQQNQKMNNNTLNTNQLINSDLNRFDNKNYHTQRLHHMQQSNIRPKLILDNDLNEDGEDFSDHTYATVINGNDFYLIDNDDIAQTMNPSHFLKLAGSDCSSCSSEPLSRLSNERPITEL